MKKVKLTSTALHWKSRLCQIKGGKHNKCVIEKRILDANTQDEKYLVKSEIEKRLKMQLMSIIFLSTKQKNKEGRICWICAIEKLKEMMILQKKRKQVAKKIARRENQRLTFQYMTKHLGRGGKSSLKRVHRVDKDNKVVEVMQDWEKIEEEILANLM